MRKVKRSQFIFHLVAIILFVSAQSPAATISGGSSLLTQSYADQIEAEIGIGPIGLINIFAKAQGDGKTSADFHASCDGQGPTIVVMRVTPNGSSSSEILGGYTPSSWQSSLGYVLTPLDYSAKVFNLSTGLFLPQAQEHQIYNSSSQGPSFGGGHDLTLNTSDLESGYCVRNTYRMDSWTYNLLGDIFDTYFDSDLCEVFQIVPEAVPVQGASWGNVKSLFR